MDDDVGWDVQRVSEFVRNNLTSHELYCSRRAGHKPFRNPKSKWVVTKDEWNETSLSTALSRMIDDIFITGVLRQAANVSITNMDTISGNVHYPKDRPYGKIAFLTEKKYVRHWFFG
ncbi:hypothetical protein COOONC_09239 [Cooperia oncophora]